MDYILNENERVDDLEFKGLKIIQNKNGFCFGIDSVLLSDYAKDIKKGSKIVDLGTGTGIISILLSAKVQDSNLVGVEIQKEVAEMAKRSVLLNKLDSRIKIINNDIKEIDKILDNWTFDAVVTNPPYKKQGTGLQNGNEKQLISRHEIECTLEDIVSTSFKLLKNNGALYMVHRPERLVDICSILRKYKMEIKNIRFVYPKQDKEPNLILLKAVKNAKEFLKVEKPLIVYNEDGTYTNEILKIYNKI